MEKPDPDYQAALRRFGHASVIERHDKLEAMVGDGPYLVGDHPTLADGLLAAACTRSSWCIPLIAHNEVRQCIVPICSYNFALYGEADAIFGPRCVMYPVGAWWCPYPQRAFEDRRPGTASLI